MDRVAMLTEIVSQNPGDPFARYGLAMEYSKAGEVEKALIQFQTLLEGNPDYTPAYFMAAQMLAGAERSDEAKTFLSHGLAAARRTRNSHAESEMQAMLDAMG